MQDLLYNLLTAPTPASHWLFMFGGILLVGIIVALLWLAQDEPKPKEDQGVKLVLAVSDVAEAVWELVRLHKQNQENRELTFHPKPVAMGITLPTPEELQALAERNRKEFTRSKPRSAKKRKS